MIDQKEYFKRLEEDKFFENIHEYYNYRKDVVEYAHKHDTNVNIISSSGPAKISDIPIIFNEESDFPLVCIAYESVRQRFLKKKLNGQ